MANEREYARKAQAYLETLCGVQPNRRVGSAGNRAATEFVARTMAPWGYALDTTPFACLDFAAGAVSLTCAGRAFDVQISPYSPGCEAAAELVVASTPAELESCACAGKLLLLKGAICAEQLMPKNFVFYNPEEHQRIYALLEAKRPAAIITATRKNPDLVGAQYPFPMIEDGDFDIPSVYCTDVEGEAIAAHAGETFTLQSEARRIPTTACNVIARQSPDAPRKIIFSAHIDAEDHTPGASDNAAGVVALLLLAEMLTGRQSDVGLEFVAFNGEDHYSAGGQMDYLRRYGARLKEAVIGINIDDAGYIHGKTAYSFYECPDALQEAVRVTFGRYAGLMEGPCWYQSDHMIFAQNGIPAMAITSEAVGELMRDITHTPNDSPDKVDCRKLVELAGALRDFITRG